MKCAQSCRSSIVVHKDLEIFRVLKRRLTMIEELRSVPLMAMNLDVAFDRVLDVGDVPTGRRRIFPVNGGHFEGPRMRGTVLPDGADWVLWRKDGAMVIDVRLVLKTDDAALISMQYVGLMYGRTPEAEAAIKSGGKLSYESFYLRTTPRFPDWPLR